MWMADQIHDQAIVDNVQNLQSRCQTLLTQLYDGIEQLMPMEHGQHQRKLGAVQPQVEMVSRYARQASACGCCEDEFHAP